MTAETSIPDVGQVNNESEGVALLVCAATRFELAAVAPPQATDAHPIVDNIAYCVTGVGMPATFFTLPALLFSLKPKRILNIGIAGAYPNSGLAIGDLILADSECYGDIGFELPAEPSFQAIAEAEFGAFYKSPLPLVPDTSFLTEAWRAKAVTGGGCTVNCCTGREATGLLRERICEAKFETMEGAAVAQVAAQFHVPMTEIRAISNRAAERDMRRENILFALAHLRGAIQTHFRQD